MGYREAIDATGTIVKDYKEFGSYQGTWIAVVETSQGKKFIEGSYGSCSGCDSFQSEFNYIDEPEEDDGEFTVGYEKVSKEEYEQAVIKYNEKLKAFGMPYVETAETKEEIIDRYTRKCTDEYAWDDDKEILKWLIAYNGNR